MFFKQSTILAFLIVFVLILRKNLVEKLKLKISSRIFDGIFDDPYLTKKNDSAKVFKLL